MDRFSIYVPRLLPLAETFIAGHRSCKGCGKALAARIAAKSFDRSRSVVSGKSSPFLHFPGSFTYEPLSAEQNTALFSASIPNGFSNRLKQSDASRPSGHKPVIAINRDVFEKDYLAFAGMFSSSCHALYLCFDNERYLADFIRRSAPPQFIINEKTHPVSDNERADLLRQKNTIPAATEDFFSYTATACPAYPFDLIEKVRKGLSYNGNAFILVLTPCPTGWIFPPRLTQRVGRAAVHTGYFPLWEKEHGVLRITHIPEKLRPLREYIALQKRFLPLTDGQVTLLQTAVQDYYQDLLRQSAQGY